MRLISACSALASAALLLPAAASAAETASLYLHPSQQVTPSSLSPVQLNRVLSYHLSIPGARIGAGYQADPAVWEFARGSKFTAASQADGEKESVVEEFFISKADERKMIVVLDAQDAALIPESIKHTHNVQGVPHKSNFDALFSSYAYTLGGLTGGLASRVGELVETVEDWIVGGGEKEVKLTKDGKLDVAATTQSFNDALSGLATFIKAGRFSGDDVPALTVVRLDTAIADLQQAYGETDFFPQARQAMSDALKDAARVVSEQGGSIAVLVLPSSSESASAALTRRDALSIFSTERRDPASVSGQAAEALKSAALPKEADYMGKCFKDEKSLEKATNECSGRGKAVLSKIGGRKCYVCKCTTKRSKGKTTKFAGAACQKVDVSGPFVLIATTVIVLIVSLTYVYRVRVRRSHPSRSSIATAPASPVPSAKRES